MKSKSHKKKTNKNKAQRQKTKARRSGSQIVGTLPGEHGSSSWTPTVNESMYGDELFGETPHYLGWREL